MGLLVDRDFGIAAWQPAWLLLVPAAAAMLARRPRGWPALLLPLAAGWFVATFVALTMQGWWFPGRQLVVVLPAAVLAIAWWARGGGAPPGGRRSPSAPSGSLAQAWVSAEGALGRLAWVVDLQSTSNPLYRAWTAVLPDYLTENAATWPLHWAWTAALAAVAVAGLAGRAGAPAGGPDRRGRPVPPRERRVLVTGAAGFIGSTLSEALVAEGWRVTGLDGFIGAYPRAAKEANLERLARRAALRPGRGGPRRRRPGRRPGRGAAGRAPGRPARRARRASGTASGPACATTSTRPTA